MPRATTLLSGAVYAALAVADSVAAGRSSASARRLRYVLKPALMPALATAFWEAPGTAALVPAPTCSAPGPQRPRRSPGAATWRCSAGASGRS